MFRIAHNLLVALLFGVMMGAGGFALSAAAADWSGSPAAADQVCGDNTACVQPVQTKNCVPNGQPVRPDQHCCYGTIKTWGSGTYRCLPVKGQPVCSPAQSSCCPSSGSRPAGCNCLCTASGQQK